MDPPVIIGSIFSNNSLLPQRTPTPVGPTALWPEYVKKSTSSLFTSTGMCGTDWQASNKTIAPTSRARLTIGSS